MGDGHPSLTPEETEGSEKLIDAMEARMRQVETFAWNVPALVIAGQSFLLTIGLDSANTHREKALAAVAGIAIVLAAVHFMWKHSWNFYLLESVIERENRRLGRHPVATGELVKSLRAEAPPEWTKFAVWAGPGDGGWRWYLVRDRRALAVWTAAFVVLLAIDVAILVKAAVDVI